MKKIKVSGSCFDVGQGYSKFVRLRNNNNKIENPILIAKINPFGVKEHKDRIKKNIFGKIEEKKNYLYFYSKTSNPKINGFITGVSTIILGKDIWGSEKGLELGKVKKYYQLKTSTSWDFNVSKGCADFIYDLWLNKSRKGICSANDVEIMVWLDSNFEVPWNEIGNFKDFKVKYMIKTKKEHPHDLGHTFAFILKSKTNNFNFDYMGLIKFCEKYLKIKIKDYWIRSLYLGTEFANNTEVKVQLKKAEFNFIEK